MKVYRTLDEIPAIQRPVVTIGSFDGVHLGHRKLIRRINQLANEIDGESVVVSFHPHPRTILDPKPVEMLTSLDEKIAILELLGVRHLVIVPFSLEFSQQTPKQYVETFLLDKIKPACLVIGYDHRFGFNRQGDIDFLRKYDDQISHGIIEIPKKEIDNITISSSKIRKFIQAGELQMANDLLDYNYTLTGNVVKGDQIGRTIGYPTANINLDIPNKLIPRPGTYAAKIQVNHNVHNAMLYIGTRPSVNDEKTIKIEAHIFDFDTDIYNEDVKLALHQYIREEQEMASLDQLKKAITQDEIAVRKYFESIKNYKPKQSRIAVAILGYNSAERLESFLPYVSESSSEAHDVYVINNGIDDDAYDLVNTWFPEVRFVQLSKNYGFAEGYNKGLQNIDAEYIVLLNDDVKVTDNWLDPIIKLMDDDNTIGACMPKILSYAKPHKYEHAGAAGGYMDKWGFPFCRGRMLGNVETIQDEYADTREVFWATGAALVTRKSLYIDFEGLDKDYFAHQEEIDYCWRLKNAGYKIMAVPESTVYHVGGSSLSYESPKKTYLNYRNNYWTLIKNLNDNKLYRILATRICVDTVSIFVFLLQGKPKLAKSALQGIFHALTQSNSAFKKRRHVKQLVEQYRISPQNRKGHVNKSLLVQYYLLRNKTFKSLNDNT